MKNSGIEWIGEIPDDWFFIRSKYVACTYTGNSIKDEEKMYFEDSTNAIPYIATKNINSTTSLIDKTDILFIKQNDSRFVKALIGDTLMCIEGGSAGKKKTYLQEKVCFVNKLCCFHPIKINGKFLFYLLQSPHYESEFNLNITGLIGGVSRSKLDNFVLPYPSAIIQQKIADYLDKKCAAVDRLIENQRAQIEKLKEYKQSVITEAVTKGLDPSAPLKDSGVEWLGKIPEKWKVRRTKYVATSIFKGNGITKEDIVIDGDTPCIRYGEIYSKYNISFSQCKTRTNKSNVPILQYFHHGDILFAGTGELVEEIGKNIVYLGKEECLAGGDIIILSHKQSPVFLNYALFATCSQIQKSRGKTKLKVVHISAAEIGNIYITVPSITEQQQIADYLDKKCAEIDKLISIKQQKIETLTEYKKSLIYEYVTGKKQVG